MSPSPSTGLGHTNTVINANASQRPAQQEKTAVTRARRCASWSDSYTTNAISLTESVSPMQKRESEKRKWNQAVLACAVILLDILFIFLNQCDIYKVGKMVHGNRSHSSMIGELHGRQYY